MQDRFRKLLEDTNLTATKFAELLNINASAVSHILSGRNRPGFDVLEKIANAFPDLDMNWLLTGEGNRYKGQISKFEQKLAEKVVSPKVEFMEGADEVKHKDTIPMDLLVSQKNPSSKIKRVLLFFEDGHFEDYHL